MKLQPVILPQWPKLAWVAQFESGAETIEVWHGPCVEANDQGCVEAVWAGEFSQGAFDQTDLVFGTGVRCRDDHVVFVSSGTLFDRLCYCRHRGSWYVSNSLPALMAVAGLVLLDGYKDYMRDVLSMMRGLGGYARAIKAKPTDVQLMYYHNLVYDGADLKEQEKPELAAQFTDYRAYRDFLGRMARQLGANATAPARRDRIALLSSISSGYDSTAASVIAREAGCTHTVTIEESTSLWRGSDSGRPIAERLGMTCEGYPGTAATYPFEETVWAGGARPGILNWTLYDYPEPLCLFFTGCHGEKMWDRVNHDHPDPFVRRDSASLGFCEFRLHRGAFQCVVPFWGVRHSQELRQVTLSEEMRPWYSNKDYDKPIARRIVEEAGVPRNMFGMLKKNVSHETSFLWPYSPGCRESFARYLRERHIYVPSQWLLQVTRATARIDSLLYQNTLKRLGIRKGWRPWQTLTGPSLLFQWANAELKRHYEEGLKAAGAAPAARPS